MANISSVALGGPLDNAWRQGTTDTNPLFYKPGEKIVFTVTIDDAEFREQNFGMVNNTYISIIDNATGKELVNCQLAENFGEATALVVGEIVRHQGIWKFRPLRRGSQKTLFDLCVDYGVSVK